MNPSTALARVIVDELVRHGVREAVLAPGSRSAPLALALHAADAAGELRLHVRVDERSAGFLALGLAKATRRPAAVVTTSGTAVANLHPAVLEAHHAGVPLIVVSADRPAEMRQTGANQTTDQVRIFNRAAPFVEIPAPDAMPSSGGSWRARVSRVVAASRRGPVHLNVCLRDPLVDTGDTLPPELTGRDGGLPWTEVTAPVERGPVTLPLGRRTLVIAGDDAGPRARELAETGGWPLLAEPSSGARTGGHVIGTYRLLLERPDLADAVERVVVFGHATLSRSVTRLLGRDDLEIVVVSGRPDFPDPGLATAVYPSVTVDGPEDPAWFHAWVSADQAAKAAVDQVLGDRLGPHRVARVVSASLPPRSLLLVGSSHPIRDLDLMAVAHPVGERRKVLANRGLSGIDGTVSTAVGAALSRPSGPAFALLGDLTFLHDSNGLIVGPEEPRPNLTIVVVNDDGGSMFATLEQGAPEHRAAFERVFGTPTGADLESLCRGMGVSYVRACDEPELRVALAKSPDGIEVVEVPVDRADRRVLDEQIRSAVRDLPLGV